MERGQGHEAEGGKNNGVSLREEDDGRLKMYKEEKKREKETENVHPA